MTNPNAASSPKKKPGFFARAIEQWDLQVLVLPGILLLFVFSYIPIYGLIMAFQEYRLGDFPGMSQWVGFLQFEYIFSDSNLPLVLRNTMVISLLKLTIGFVCPIIFAVFLNEMGNQTIKKTIQTVSYLPHFISWTVCALLMFDFLSTDGGAVNEMLMGIGLIDKPIGFFQDGKYFWGIALLTDIWKELGWNSIIFISALAGIDPELYDAARIDGAGRWKQTLYITLPCLIPTIVILFILRIGQIMNVGYEKIILMYGPATYETADVISSYVYRVGLTSADYSYSTAINLFNSVINFVVLFAANHISKRVSDTSLW